MSLVSACSNKKEETTKVESDKLLYPFDIPEEKFNGVIDDICDYVICYKEQKKDIKNINRFSEQLATDYENRKHIQADLLCPYNCEMFEENGYCEHLNEAWENSRVTVDQSELVSWYGENIHLMNLKLQGVSYNVYFLDDPTNIKIVIKYSDLDNSVGTIWATYDSTKDIITDLLC